MTDTRPATLQDVADLETAVWKRLDGPGGLEARLRSLENNQNRQVGFLLLAGFLGSTIGAALVNAWVNGFFLKGHQ